MARKNSGKSKLPPGEEKKLRAMMKDVDGEDKFPFQDLLERNQKGELALPKDIGDRLRFMEGHLVHPDYKRYRHIVVWTFTMMGLPIMEIMKRLNRTERTVHRWRKEAREYFKDAFTNMDVAELHADRMTRLTIARERLWQILARQNISPHEAATIVASMVGVDKLEDRILKQSGYYEVFNLKAAGNEDAESKADEFRKELDEAFMDDTSLAIEADVDEDDWEDDDDDKAVDNV